MEAGRLRTSVTIETPREDGTRGPDGRFDLADYANWQVYAIRFAEVLAVTMRERSYAQQPVADGTVTVTIRRDPVTDGITPRMRVLDGSSTYNIDGVVRVGSPVKLIELRCVEVA